MVSVTSMQPARTGWTHLGAIPGAKAVASQHEFTDEPQAHSRAVGARVARWAAGLVLLAIGAVIAYHVLFGAAPASGPYSGPAPTSPRLSGNLEGAFTQAGATAIMVLALLGVAAFPVSAWWRRRRASREWGSIAAAARAAGTAAGE